MRAERATDAFDDLDRAHLAEHQQARGDAAQELRNLVEALRFAGADSDCAIASLMRAMLTMHSRSTASGTWRNSVVSRLDRPPSPAAARRA